MMKAECWPGHIYLLRVRACVCVCSPGHRVVGVGGDLSFALLLMRGALQKGALKSTAPAKVQRRLSPVFSPQLCNLFP